MQTYLQHSHAPCIEQQQSSYPTLLIFRSRTSYCQKPMNDLLVSPTKDLSDQLNKKRRCSSYYSLLLLWATDYGGALRMLLQHTLSKQLVFERLYMALTSRSTKRHRPRSKDICSDEENLKSPQTWWSIALENRSLLTMRRGILNQQACITTLTLRQEQYLWLIAQCWTKVRWT